MTVCCANRKRLLADDTVHATFREFAARGQQERHIAVGRYVLMPDHVHVFVTGPAEFRLEQWVRVLKTELGKTLKALGHKPEFWQRGFFDHVLRNDESYGQKWQYVRDNPACAGFVVKSEDWPYSGELVSIDRA